EIAPFVFAEQLLRMGSGATKKMVTEIERIRGLHEPDPSIAARVPFAAGKAELIPQVAPMLDEIARFLVDSDHITLVEIGGYCDPSDAETDDARRALSEKRAETVRDYLVEHRVNAKRLAVKGHGTAKAL